MVRGCLGLRNAEFLESEGEFGVDGAGLTLGRQAVVICEAARGL